MKKLILTLFFVSNLQAANIVVYNSSDTVVPGRVTAYLISRNTPDYLADPNDVNTPLWGYLIHPDLSAVQGVNRSYWKVVGSSAVIPMTDIEINALVTVSTEATTVYLRDTAQLAFDGRYSEGAVRRALVDLMLREINILRNLHGLSDRTTDQFKTQFKNKINNGDYDE
jgi:hypothetical protein